MDEITDQDILNEMLVMENETVKSYNFTMLSCVSPKIHENMLSILCQEHQICLDVKGELSKRGFFAEPPASKSDIEFAVKNFDHD